MTIQDPVNNERADLEDYYLSQSKELVDRFLAEFGYTHEMLDALPEEEAHALIRQALDYAARQIARIESMVRLGQRDIDTKPEDSPHKRHSDRLERYFRTKNKS